MFKMIECPECGSKKVTIESVKTDATEPFDSFEFSCNKCGHWWFEKNTGGKGDF
jgi:uncharacterized Zn finger protein